MQLFDVQTQEPIGDKISLGDAPIVAVKFDGKGAVLFAAEASGSVHLWDVATKAVLEKLPGPADLNEIALSSRGNLLACAHRGVSEVILWNVAKRREVGRLEGHKAGVTSVNFSPNGRWLASGSLDGTIRLWDMSARETKAATSKSSQ